MIKKISHEENTEKHEDDFSLNKSKERFPATPLEAESDLAIEKPADSPAKSKSPLEKFNFPKKTLRQYPAEDKESTIVAEQEIEEVEDILEEDLQDVYREMDPNTQKTFREQGEETAREIVSVVHKVKHHTKKIIILISKWLKIIPGINKFFVEQEAKIKTDRIEEMHSKEHKK